MAILAAINSGGVRRELDFYPTPPVATHALLPLISPWSLPIWNPCCGDGAISKVLESAGYAVQSSDLVDRGFGRVQDFFEVQSPWQWSIITNPPFYCAHDFIAHAYEIGVQRMALLLKSNFFSTRKSLDVWNTWRPRIIAPLTWRLDFTGAGAPHTDCQWTVWEGLSFETSFQPLRKPRREKDSEIEKILIEAGLITRSAGATVQQQHAEGA
jgi:hypothetical protein